MTWEGFFGLLIFYILPGLLVLYGMHDWFFDIKNLFSLKSRNSHEKELRQTGLKTEAIVKDIVQTGTFVNDNPEVELIVKSTDNGTDIRIRTVVSLIMIPRLQPGCKVIIFVNPNEPTDAILEP